MKVKFLFAALALASLAHAQAADNSAILTWVNPTKDTANNPTTISGNKVYRGAKADGSDAVMVKQFTTATTTWTDTPLAPGNWCYSVTAYDGAAQESAKSATVCKLILQAKPGQIITITIQ